MNKPNVSEIVKSVRMSLSKHSPEILIGVGIAGMITTTVLAVKATPKALKLIEQEKEARKADRERGVDEQFAPDKISKKDIVKLCWKCYIPAVLTGTVSTVCLIGSNSVSTRRAAALTTAYKLSETALSEYKEKVIETIGEKKEKVIREAIDKDHIEKNPVKNHEVIMTGKGTTRCYDKFAGRYFDSDIDHIKKAVNELNRSMLLHDYVSLNDFYDELGLPHTKLGNDLGWSILDGYMDVEFSSHLCEDGTPCLAISYTLAPKYEYDRYS